MVRPTEKTYDELQDAYDFFNRELFGGQLPDCIITLQREKRTMGYFSPNRFVSQHGLTQDEIALNPIYFDLTDITETMQTIAHEMAHQWQQHYGQRKSRHGYHNKEWAAKMIEIGLMPTDTGKPGGKTTGFKISDYPIERGAFLESVRKLKKEKFAISWRDRFSLVQQTMEEGAQPITVVTDTLTGEEVTHPRSKTKYVHQCVDEQTGEITDQNVWGKPGLNLVCGDCGRGFEQT
ncbi:SprT-like domain-containing protein [Aestuariispira insulae]|uniref:SprT-like family protein n=1 Tax=Aestuariispira insulae TaxID=1461337 RepID=A0A3D9H3R8_9PROT|nr:SprT-like domain-containing protein [Aestuariispira insulae]RED44130.1 SprT-like family protein [Aestuariispira insulae]